MVHFFLVAKLIEFAWSIVNTLANRITDYFDREFESF